MLDLTHAFIYNADRRLDEIAANKVSMQKMAKKLPPRNPMASWPYHTWIQLNAITTKVESKYVYFYRMQIDQQKLLH